MPVKNNTRVVYNVQLPDQFLNIIKSVMKDELEIAQEKWGITVSETIKEQILHFSLEQVECRVSECMKARWNCQPVVRIKIWNLYKTEDNSLRRDILLPKDRDSVKGQYLLLTANGYCVDKEENEGSFLAEDLPKVVFDTILTWARYAVFYGVGSWTVSA